MKPNEKFVGAYPSKRRATSDPGCGDKWARVARAFPRSDASHQRPDVTKNRQGFSRFHGRTRVKKLVHINKVRLASWNIGSLTGKLGEIGEVMNRRKIDILCLQETKWVGEKSKEVAPWGYKLWYTGKDRNKNGVGIMVSKSIQKDVVQVRRNGDRILSIKLVLGEEIINILSVYAPQVGLDEASKNKFWEDLDVEIQCIPNGEKLIVGGDLNGHVGKIRDGFDQVHGGYGFGDRNSAGDSILEFATSYDLRIVNTWFKKRESHLVTYRSGSNSSQIDYFLTRNIDISICKDCKVIPGESVTTQHRLLVLDIRLKSWAKRNGRVEQPRIKWWRLNGVEMVAFKDRLVKEANWEGEEDVNTLWAKMTRCIQMVAKDTLGVAKGRAPPGKESWWWTEEVKTAVNDKRESYKALKKCKDGHAYDRYKDSRRHVKKVIREARAKVHEELYRKLDTKEGEKEIFKIARLREKKSKDLNGVRCIKDIDNNVLVKDEEIKHRWRDYFDKLFNEDKTSSVGDVEVPVEEINRDFIRRIKMSEVKDALKKMKVKKALGPDDVPIEVWKCMGDVGIRWVTNLFNKIWLGGMMPDEWRNSTLVPLYKSKGDMQSCNNYRGIKLMCHTMKLWERVIEFRLRRIVDISENQFGFMPGRSTTEAIHLLRQMMEKYRAGKKDLHMIFIDLEKAYDKVPREVLWWVLKKRYMSLKYINIIKDMYEGVTTNVRTSGGMTDSFSITMGLHQGSALSPFLFALVMDEVTRHIQDKIPWCMLFADDIVLVDETRSGLNDKLELWRHTLETRGFRLSRSKTEYMECSFSSRRIRDPSVVKLGGETVPISERFRYLGSVVQNNAGIESDINHRIQAGWMRWRSASGFLCDRNVPLRLKGKFYKKAIRPALLYGSECWAIKKVDENKMAVAEMRMLRWMCGKTRKDKIRNDDIRSKLNVAPIEDKMRESRLRWFGHVLRRPMSAPVRKSEDISVGNQKKGRGRPLKTWMQVIRNDMGIKQIDEQMALDRNEWRRKIHCTEED